MNKNISEKLGFWGVFSIVTGSQIGTGILMLPTSLAPFGVYNFLGWGCSIFGAIALASVFAALCERNPETGGPHIYVNKAFGKCLAFFTGWTYWVISWISTTAVIVASISYLAPLIGEQSSQTNLLLELLLLLFVTVINSKGVGVAGRVELFLVLIKFIPLLFIPLCAIYYFDSSNFEVAKEVQEQSISSIIGVVALSTFWCFIGIESGTVPAGAVENPSTTIPKAIIFGTLAVAMLYLLNITSIMGLIPGGELAKMQAPYVVTTNILLGSGWDVLISVITSIICIGTLNAWTLTSGQIALGLAQNGMMPKRFGVLNQNSSPSFALIVSAIGIVPFLIMTSDSTLARQISQIIDFSVIAFIFVYLICSMSLVKIIFDTGKFKLYELMCVIFAIVFCVTIIVFTDVTTILIALSFALSGIPVYYWMLKTP
jgi:APA family basic amino acid/polyamine antiporter